MNSPMSATDASGLDICDGWGCLPGGGGGGGGGCGDADCWDPGSCDPFFGDCLPWGYPVVPGPPKIQGYKNLDPMTESLGLPAGMRLPSGDLLDIFTGGSGTCEFGVCGGGAMGFENGSLAGGVAPIDMSSLVLSIYAFAHAPNKGPKGNRNYCSVLDPSCKRPNPVLNYGSFLACMGNSGIEQLTEDEDARGPVAVTILTGVAASALKGKTPAMMGIVATITLRAYLGNIAAKANKECSDLFYPR